MLELVFQALLPVITLKNHVQINPFLFLKEDKIKIVYDNTYNLLKRSTAAIVTSGTATLETALFDVPQIVCYKSSLFSYLVLVC